MSVHLTELADRYERLPAQLLRAAVAYPGAYVVRNHLGNLAIMTPEGTYVGWIDVVGGEVGLL